MVDKTIQIEGSNGARSGERILRLRGPLNIHTIFNFQSAVRTEESLASTLIIDFKDVPHIDSAGLGAVVGAYVSAQRQQRKLGLAGMNERVKALVSMSNLMQVFKPYETVEEASRALAPVN